MSDEHTVSDETIEAGLAAEAVEAKRRMMWEAKGYEVRGACPECGWGLILRHGGDDQPPGRWVCTSYGQCELSPG
jgi:ribosomal protein S27AE